MRSEKEDGRAEARSGADRQERKDESSCSKASESIALPALELSFLCRRETRHWGEPQDAGAVQDTAIMYSTCLRRFLMSSYITRMHIA